MIRKKSNGKYDVVSENGKKRLGKNLTKKQAKKRIQQVEYFKHKKGK